MRRFAGKRALVTGGTRGIGAAVARALLAEGAEVAINGRTAASVAAALPEFGEGAAGASGDVATVEGCESVKP